MKKILVSGCSYTVRQSWPEHLFQGCSVTNKARGGAGNDFISFSIFDDIRTNGKPDFVFILWSGIRRREAYFPKETRDQVFKDALIGSTQDSIAVFSGGNFFKYKGNVKPSYHPEVDEFFKLQYSSSNEQFLVEQSSQKILACHAFLESQKIDYRFSFIYNIFSNDFDWAPALGSAVSKSDGYLNFLDWNKYINITPFEYGIKNDLISSDNMHLTHPGMNSWADEISVHLPKF